MSGVRISDSARELLDLLDLDRFDHIETKRLTGASVIDKAGRSAGESAGLRHQGEGPGAYLIVQRPGGQREKLTRRAMYAVVPVGSEVDAAKQLARAIASKHGPGNWWDTGGCVGYCDDDGMVRAGMLDGKEHVMLRAYYFHDPKPGLAVEPPEEEVHDAPAEPTPCLRCSTMLPWTEHKNGYCDPCHRKIEGLI